MTANGADRLAMGGCSSAACAGERTAIAGPRGERACPLPREPRDPDRRLLWPARAPGEPRFNCGRGRIERIEGSRIVTDRPVEVVFEVTYRFTATGLGAGGQPCAGSSTRWFTFDREGDGTAES